MSENGEIYIAGKSFTLPPGLTGWTNSTSVFIRVTQPITLRANQKRKTIKERPVQVYREEEKK